MTKEEEERRKEEKKKNMSTWPTYTFRPRFGDIYPRHVPTLTDAIQAPVPVDRPLGVTPACVSIGSNIEVERNNFAIR